jgi:hypothetical protein
MAESFSQTGGARIGKSVFRSLNATWPFAKLTVDNTELRISCLGKKWVFPRDSIRLLKKHGGFFSTGLRIEHSIEGYAPFVVFWTFGFVALKQELERRDYRLSAD